MAANLHECFERSCRLCAELHDVSIMIFSPETEPMNLRTKINKYLLIDVDENDKLPKSICIRCCTKLQTLCEFIDGAHKSQEVLTNRSILLDQMPKENNDAIKGDRPSLTCGGLQIETYVEDDKEITEMEVSVDPMMILENCDSNSSKADDHLQTCYEDAKETQRLGYENVTIELVRKCVNDTNSEVNGSMEDPSSATNTVSIIKSKTYNSMRKPFSCVVCRRGFLNELALRNHSWVHTNEEQIMDDTVFSCTHCSETFQQKPDLYEHLKRHRLSNTCLTCGRRFKNKDNLEYHLMTHQSVSQAYICKICGRAYNSKSNLKTHSVTHSTERPYSCHICSKTFKRNQDLKFHVNQHTGAKPYKCPFCDKSFASSGNCYSHRYRMHPGREIKPSLISKEIKTAPKYSLPAKFAMVMVNGIQKYKCKICEHTFLKRDNYKCHMYQHTGEKPFYCTLCPERFVTRRGVLSHHMKDHPGKEVPLALLSKNELLQ